MQPLSEELDLGGPAHRTPQPHMQPMWGKVANRHLAGLEESKAHHMGILELQWHRTPMAEENIPGGFA